MELVEPKLAKCDDRNILPRNNSESGSPEEWFNSRILAENNLLGFNYDFFVNWQKQPNVVTPVVWIKRIIRGESSDELIRLCTRNDVVSLIENCELSDYLNKLARHCFQNKLRLQLLIFRDVDWAKAPEYIIVVEVRWHDDGLKYSISRIDLAEIQERIRLASGGSVRIGNKGLIYGTSMLECYLSHTDSLYPGDVDLILTNNEYENIAILEFKKHNLESSIQAQQLSNYYPRPDGRKYDRLAILRNYLQQNPKLIVIYYPTNNTEGAVIEYVSGEAETLVSSDRRTLVLPTKGNNDSYRHFLNEIIEFVNSI